MKAHAETPGGNPKTSLSCRIPWYQANFKDPKSIHKVMVSNPFTTTIACCTNLFSVTSNGLNLQNLSLAVFPLALV